VAAEDCDMTERTKGNALGIAIGLALFATLLVAWAYAVRILV
jgi:hypothetical protein